MSNFLINCSHSFSLIKSNSLLNKINVSSSDKDPSEICKKWINSFVPFLAALYAICTGTETEALLIWEINPNFSSVGNRFVTKYISLTNSKLLIQEFNFL